MPSKRADRPGPRRYAICVAGGLGEDWSEWFDGLTVTTDAQGDTVLTGPVADQTALYGLLARLRDLGLPLISVYLIEGEREPS